MPRMTPGYAKNIIRRALRAVVDPEPSRADPAGSPDACHLSRRLPVLRQAIWVGGQRLHRVQPRQGTVRQSVGGSYPTDQARTDSCRVRRGGLQRQGPGGTRKGRRGQDRDQSVRRKPFRRSAGRHVHQPDASQRRRDRERAEVGAHGRGQRFKVRRPRFDVRSRKSGFGGHEGFGFRTDSR